MLVAPPGPVRVAQSVLFPQPSHGQRPQTQGDPRRRIDKLAHVGPRRRFHLLRGRLAAVVRVHSECRLQLRLSSLSNPPVNSWAVYRWVEVLIVFFGEPVETITKSATREFTGTLAEDTA